MYMYVMVYKYKIQVVILEWFTNPYYFGEISQIPRIDYFTQHIQNIQWKKKYNSSISSNFFQKKLEEITIFQFPPGVPEEIHFFREEK